MFAVLLSPFNDAIQNELMAQFCRDQEAKKEYEKHLNKDFNLNLSEELETVLSKVLVRALPLSHSLLHEKFKKYKDMREKFLASVEPDLNSIEKGFISLFLENADARRDYATFAAKKFDESAKTSLTYIFITALKQSYKGTEFLRKLHNRVKEVWQKTEGAKKTAESGAAESAAAAGLVSKLTVTVTAPSGSTMTGTGAVVASSPGGAAVPLTPSGGIVLTFDS